jgi:hypothetical protein
MNVHRVLVTIFWRFFVRSDSKADSAALCFGAGVGSTGATCFLPSKTACGIGIGAGLGAGACSTFDTGFFSGGGAGAGTGEGTGVGSMMTGAGGTTGSWSTSGSDVSCVGGGVDSGVDSLAETGDGSIGVVRPEADAFC